MLNLDPKTVCFLVSRARILQNREEAVLDIPGSPMGALSQQDLDDYANDPAFKEFKTTIDNMDQDQQQALIALMWVGRGEFNKNEWVVALQVASRNCGENTTEYLISHPQLADHLLEGLNLLGHTCDA